MSKVRMSNTYLVRVVVVGLLLALYVLLVLVAIAFNSLFSGEMAAALSLIAGLVSALVISELALTQPGETPSGRSFTAGGLEEGGVLRIVTTVYITAWLICGLASLLYGWFNPEAIDSIKTLGKAWLGTAVAAGYAYFGVKPSKEGRHEVL